MDELLTDGQMPRGAQRQGLGRHGGHWGVPVGLTVGKSFKLLRSGWQARQELWQMGEPMFFSGEGPAQFQFSLPCRSVGPRSVSF